MSLWVLAKDASVGKPLDELPKIQVWVTLDGGHEDIEAYQQYGHSGLRRQKVLRISEEILEQVWDRDTEHTKLMVIVEKIKYFW